MITRFPLLTRILVALVLSLALAACTASPKNQPPEGVAMRPTGATITASIPDLTMRPPAFTSAAQPERAKPEPVPTEGDTFVLPPLRIEEQFGLSFGFAVKIFKDARTTKVIAMYVDRVDPDSDAARKGLAAGDRLVSLEGKPVTDYEATFVHGSELNRILGPRKRGDRVTLEVIPMLTQKAKVLTIVDRPFRRDDLAPPTVPRL